MDARSSRPHKKSPLPMRYNNTEKLSNYFDMFILFIELDIFIWVLFELSYVFRPVVYEVGRILVILYILEIIVQFFFNPSPKAYFKKCWHLFVSAAILFLLFNRISAVDTSHRFIFIYSKLFLVSVEFILFAKILLQAKISMGQKSFINKLSNENCGILDLILMN